MDSSSFPSPFPGLHAFEPKQTDLFFGRDLEIRQLIQKLRAQRFVGVVGVSGIGKSSLVRAGLVPRLPQGYMPDVAPKWRTVILKPGNAPMTALARQLAVSFGLDESSVADKLAHSSRGLLQLAADHLTPDENLFVLVDQFEELLRFAAMGSSQRETATEFVDALLGASGHGPLEARTEKQASVFVVLTMRSEFLGKCTMFPGLAEALNDGQFLVPRLERSQLRMAIEGPVAMVGGRISPVLVQQLLNDAANEIDQLPLVQFALTRMWDISAADRARGEPLGPKHYKAVGESIVACLNNAADTAIAELDKRKPGSAAIVRKLFERLAEPGNEEEEVRRPASLSELVAVTGASSAVLKSLVEALAEQGFLTISADDDPEINVTHESLIRRWQVLNRWVKDEATSADVYRRLAGAAMRHGELYRGRDLDEALRWQREQRPTGAWAARYPVENGSFEGAIAFLARSRRWRWISGGLIWAGSLLIFAALSGALYFQRESQSHLRTLNVDRLFYQAQSLSKGPSSLAHKSLLLGLEALSARPSAQVDRFVREQIAIAPMFQASMSHAGVVTALNFSEDSKLLVSASEDKTLRVWEVATGRELSKVALPYEVQAIRFDPLSGYIATQARNAPRWNTLAGSASPSPLRVALWRLQGTTLVGPLFEKDYPDFGGRMAIALGAGKLWMADGTNLISLNLDSIDSGPTSVELKGTHQAFTPDAGYVLSSDRGTVTVRNLQTATTKTLRFPEALNSRDVVSIVVSADGKYVGLTGIVPQPDNTVTSKLHIWSIEPFAEVGVGLSGGADALSASGTFVADIEAGPIASATVVEAMTGKTIGTMEESETDQGGRNWNTASFSRDNQRIALASSGSAVRIFTLDPWREIFRIGLGPKVAKFAWSVDDSMVAVGAETGLVTVWNLRTTDAGSEFAARNFFYSPSRLYSLLELDRSNSVLLDSAGRSLQHFNHESFRNFSFSADERRFAWIDRDSKKVSLYALPQNTLVCTFDYPDNLVRFAFLRSDTFTMVTSDGYWRSWSVENCRPGKSISLGQFEPDRLKSTASHWQVYFSPQGRIVAINLNDDVDAMALWDVDAGVLLGTLPAKSFWGLDFSPDEKLVSGMATSGIAVWRVASAQELWHQSVDDWNWRPRFDPTGLKLAGSAGHIMRVWDSVSGKILLEDNDESAVAHGVSFDRFGKMVASAWSSGRVKIWDIAAGAQISDIPIQVNWGSYPFLEFNLDNLRVVVGDDGRENLLRVLQWRSQDLVREGCRHVAFNLSAEDWSRLGGYYKPSEPTCSGLPVHK